MADRTAEIYSTAEVSTSVVLLTRLREGNVDGAIELLEMKLDSGLIGLYYGGKLTEEKQDETTLGTLKMAKDYRAKYPRKTDFKEGDKAVKAALSAVD